LKLHFVVCIVRNGSTKDHQVGRVYQTQQAKRLLDGRKRQGKGIVGCFVHLLPIGTFAINADDMVTRH
jgi:hypothetical protein